MTTSPLSITRSLLLVLGASAICACGSTETSPGGNGGAGIGSGGTTAPGGSGGGTTTAAGSGGSTSATSGTGGAGGATTASTGTDGKLCPPPQALITDFTYAPSGSGGADTSQVHFGNASTLAGSEYFYPTTGIYALTSDVSGSNWHITGNVGDYSGIGLYFDSCNRIDASAYAGISFKISGLVENGNGITFVVDTLNDTITAAWLNTHGGTAKDGDPGRCEPPASATNQWAQSTCAAPNLTIPVTDTPTVQSILWSDFSGGKPDTGVKPSDIVGIHWFFPNPDGIDKGSPTPYKVDVTIDDLSFVPQ